MTDGVTSGGHDPGELARRSAEAMYAADEASRRLGITIDLIEPGHAVARMTVDERMVNGHGIAHGGFLFLLADSAFAFACNTHGRVTVSIENTITYPRKVGVGDVLVATEFFSPRLNDDGFKIAAGLCHVMKERPLDGAVTTP